MNPSQLKKFVAVLFTIVISGIIFIQVRNCGHREVLTHLEAKQVLSLRFYQNSLRDPRDLNLPVTEKKDIEGFIAAIKAIRTTSWAIKSLEARVRTPMVLNIKAGGEIVYTINIYRAKQSGDTGIVSINEEGPLFTTGAGVYESKELLHWAETMARRKNFESIMIKY